MISISTVVYSLTGNVIIRNTEKCSFMELPARVSRSATLDGGAVIIHGGVSSGDRTFVLNVRIAHAQEIALKYIYNNFTSVLVSISDGVFLGVISDISISEGKLSGKILIKSKES